MGDQRTNGYLRCLYLFITFEILVLFRYLEFHITFSRKQRFGGKCLRLGTTPRWGISNVTLSHQAPLPESHQPPIRHLGGRSEGQNDGFGSWSQKRLLKGDLNTLYRVPMGPRLVICKCTLPQLSKMPELALSPPGEGATPSPHKGSQVHLRGCTGEQFMLLMTAGGITLLQSGWYYSPRKGKSWARGCIRPISS